MDEELTLHELRRLEAERKLRTIPTQVLETVWIREAQIEGVIDAVLAVTQGGDAKAYAHARHMGEWCARIASALSDGPEPPLARRVGVLADVDPAVLERIEELKHLASYVRGYQEYAIEGLRHIDAMCLIASVADEFESRASLAERSGSHVPRSTIVAMLSEADDAKRPIVEALLRATYGVRTSLKCASRSGGACDKRPGGNGMPRTIRTSERVFAGNAV
jgi:hypothetical protein